MCHHGDQVDIECICPLQDDLGRLQPVGQSHQPWCEQRAGESRWQAVAIGLLVAGSQRFSGKDAGVVLCSGVDSFEIRGLCFLFPELTLHLTVSCFCDHKPEIPLHPTDIHRL